MNLAAGKFGELLKTGEFLMVFSETPDLSVYNPEWDKLSQQSSSSGINNENIGNGVKTISAGSSGT